MTDYKDILSKQWKDLPQPKLLPNGSWLLRVTKVIEPEADAKWPQFTFMMAAKQAMDDVSAADIEALGEDYDVSQSVIFHRMWASRETDFDKICRFLEKLGLDMDNLTIGDALEKAKGSEIVAYVDTETYNDKDGNSVTRNTAGSFSAAE